MPDAQKKTDGVEADWRRKGEEDEGTKPGVESRAATI